MRRLHDATEPMALFPQEALNDGVRKREVFGWAMYDFANSGYTTVVLTAVFNVYFVGVAAGGADWATLAWTMVIAASSLIVMFICRAWARMRTCMPARSAS
jgi:UMF1 family MFS transporter